MPEQSAIGLVFCGKEMPYAGHSASSRKTEISNKKYCETTVGELRKTYGADFHCFLLAMHSLPLDLKR
jgi:hypothetical protein